MLGQQAREKIDIALQSDELSVSAITFWELSLLQRKGRLQLPDIQNWRSSLLDMSLIEIPWMAKPVSSRMIWQIFIPIRPIA